MLRIVTIAVATAVLLSAFSRAQAGIVVTVDKTAQRLTVDVDGYTRHQWAVSTARWGYRTPNGSYRPQWLARKWFSTKYDGSPMPFSIFFNGGYAIHGSYEISRLGRPASHGCIRLHPANAAVLFALVKANMKSTQIVVTGDGPQTAERARGLTRDDGRRPSLRQTRGAGRNPYMFEDIFNSAPGDAGADADRAVQRWENLR